MGCDVGDNDSVQAAVEEAAGIHGRIDVLFNNAGGGSGSSFPNEPIEEFLRVIQINLTGTFASPTCKPPLLLMSLTTVL